MPQPVINRYDLRLAYVVLAVSVALMSGAVVAWLTMPELSQQIWPADVNVFVVRMLGGTASASALGQTTVDLSPAAVLLRFGPLAIITVLLSRRQSHHRKVTAESHFSAVLQTAFALLFCVSWWLLALAGDLGWSWARSVAMGILPLWLTVTLGLVSWVWLRTAVSHQQLTPGHTSLVPVGLCAAAALAWIAVSYWMNYCLYEQLFIPHGDSAMYEEHLWNIRHGKGFRSYLDQGLFLGEHFQVIHLLLIPLHVMWPSHLLLELCESVALGSCVIPIYLMAIRHSGSRWAACLLAIAWLFYFPMHFLDIAIDQKSFRPIALGIPFLFWMIEFAERRLVGWTAACLCLTLAAKEDMALVTCPLLAVLAFRATRESQQSLGIDSKIVNVQQSRQAGRWLAAMSLCSAIYVGFVVTVGIPWFRAGDAVHYSRYFGDLGNSPGELVHTALTAPHRVISKLLGARTFLYAAVFLAPLALVPLRQWKLLTAAAISFIMLSLMELGDADSALPPVPYHHFHAPLLPVFIWAAAAGLTDRKRTVASNAKWRLALPVGTTATDRALLILLCCIGTSLTGSLMPCGVTFWSEQSAFGLSKLYQPNDPQQQERARMADIVVQQIPRSARVASTDYIHTRLTHCERSYDYSDYVRKVNNYERGVPEDTEFIVIDTGHRYSTIRTADDVPELQQPDTPWRLLPDTTNGHFLILQRQSRAH